MTAPVKQTERDAQLSAEGKRHMAEIRAKRALTVAITNESWGKTMTPMMRQAFAAYMQRFRLDISEVDNLGGKPYRNGFYYRRKVAEARSQGRVEWSKGEHIGIDSRLDALEAAGDEWAKAENVRRARERIRWAVPLDATHAYVVSVKLKSDGLPQEGCDWITPTRTKTVKKWEDRKYAGTEEKLADPVGAEEPEKTVITRAWRRAGLLVCAEIPELRSEEQVLDAEAEVVEAEIQTIAEQEAENEQRAELKPQGLVTSGDPADPYGVNEKPKAEPVPVGRLSDEELDERRFEDENQIPLG